MCTKIVAYRFITAVSLPWAPLPASFFLLFPFKIFLLITEFPRPFPAWRDGRSREPKDSIFRVYPDSRLPFAPVKLYFREPT